ncbi:glycosyltransferase family 4 protein [Shewanella sp. ALD9]|uniref:glycosyltransferase family 4 protein n=1 Tax=Shewanella sp. ALD9 TaxID=2058330 RepID=UPI000C32E084|nr:glycosyltransferase family 4 protein [Shewanella sp. ALD9]PKH31898.1 hypothetical protein CXF88_08310 [Shewanella sp. ALD9]
MKIGFFHDHIFTKKNDVIYTTGTLNKSVWDRFFDAGVNKLIVCGRFSNSIKPSQISERDNVTFVFSRNLSNIRSLLFGTGNNVVEKIVNDVDIVVARVPSEIGFNAIKFGKKFNKKVICEVVACPYDGLNYHGSFFAKLYAPIIKLRMKYWVKQCDGALYVTEHALQERYSCNGLTTNASNVEIDLLANVESVDFRYKRLSNRIKDRTVKVGLMGTMQNDSKGISVALQALDSLENISFHVIGTGDPKKYLEISKKFAVNFNYDGFMAIKNDVYDWLDDIDIYIQPSFQEGLPRATIEAMSRGCPVISSDAGGLSELTMSDYIHTSGDYVKLRQDIIKVLNDPNLAQISSIHSLNIASRYLSSSLKNKRSHFYSHFINN